MIKEAKVMQNNCIEWNSFTVINNASMNVHFDSSLITGKLRSPVFRALPRCTA